MPHARKKPAARRGAAHGDCAADGRDEAGAVGPLHREYRRLFRLAVAAQSESEIGAARTHTRRARQFTASARGFGSRGARRAFEGFVG
eukprot:6877610-Prymnesium_polylepis.3